ncbi:YncE family protein [Aneurinibacillus aneurinilyticus]|jgi:DNA-binding beta-propeller fold protein YncE|uniref:PQQ-binding-like beta-propeller repeat protein n=2 Tax=Aneurinibacillus aneurinilyticus TaxID=1391 RepID=A0A848CZB6_ANEAE|nr:PQQ-binding-like beta-propeller repeat protein [Aneurinibacillus aneurinilyticus]ERI09340.1 hypothetical protein HMPREF0083_02619 [Aneurinibacillus aneurinilyticus ATCC 12856]MED0672189.1 PQQ-binding-like beta-propeller repeat protein [Aneurinibacillus aneurinilyticus]MED0704702.1 PQQ-binding-like beta-propeller repeat protein [Aneurinibacillus aneurinilyticus]MED0723980.1 PQQ-binding-like beta-propeller repeat protein [Aneurinibacillus aneurinilyticus]MED0731989.1 PQQ-binding-like beta-pro
MGKKRPVIILILAFIWLFMTGCQPITFAKIPDGASILAVLNAREQTVSFLNAENGKSIATWKPDFMFSRMLLMNSHTVLLYGKNAEDVHMLDMRTGKQTGVWKTGKGIVNATLSISSDKIYFADKLRGTVRIYTTAGQQRDEIKVGPSPFTMLEDKTHDTLYVMDLQDARMREVDLATSRVVRTFRLNESPMGGLLAADRGELWIGGHGRGDFPEEEVSVFSSKTGQKLRNVHAPFMPVEFVRYNKDTLFVLSHGSNTLRRIAMDTGQSTGELALGANPFGMVSNGRLLYITSYESNQIYMVDPETMRTLKTLRAGDGPIQMFVREGDGQ